MNSEKFALQYYENMKKPLHEQTSHWSITQEVAFLLPLITGEKVLDVGCGYGRLTIPLAQKGIDIIGIDLSPKMIAKAREESTSTSFTIGSMLNLPYPSKSFDVCVCMWSTFNSLLTREDQLQALAEFHRVLKPLGEVILDLPDGDAEKWDIEHQGIGEDGHIVVNYFVGDNNRIYLHNSHTIEKLCEPSPFNEVRVKKEIISGRKRMIITLRK